MSLTSHLKDPDSPVRRFILESAPDLAIAGTRGSAGKIMASRFGFDELTALTTQSPIPPEVKPTNRKSHATIAGMALDYRVRMDLPGFDITETTAWRGLDRLGINPSVVHRGKHIHRVLSDALNMAYLMLEQEDSLSDYYLAAVSIELAWCETIYRAGPARALGGDLGRQIKRASDSVKLFQGIDESLVLDVARMHETMTDVIRQWKEADAAGATVVTNPQFLGSPAVGGADADWAVGGVLIELKTREDITSPWLRETLLQLVGYTLLDLDDSLRIRRGAIALPRQPYFMMWDMDDLLGGDADEALPELRARFMPMLMDMVKPRPTGDDSEPDATLP